MKEFEIVRRETVETTFKVKAASLNDAMAFARRGGVSPSQDAPGIAEVAKITTCGAAGYRHVKKGVDREEAK